MSDNEDSFDVRSINSTNDHSVPSNLIPNQQNNLRDVNQPTESVYDLEINLCKYWISRAEAEQKIEGLESEIKILREKQRKEKEISEKEEKKLRLKDPNNRLLKPKFKKEKIPTEKKQEIIQLLGQGRSVTSIKRKTGLPKSSLYSIMEESKEQDHEEKK